MKPRLLFVINSLAGGGAERVFTSLLSASENRRSEYDMTVALLDQDPPGYALPDWIPVHQLDCGGKLAPSLARLGRLIRTLDPDLVVSFLTRANIAAALSGLSRRRPVVISERANTNAKLDRGSFPMLRKALVRLAYPRADRVIVVSPGVGDCLAADYGVRRDRLTVITNPVDVEALRAVAAEEPAIEVRPDDVVVVGRLRAEKNLPLAVRGFARSGWAGRLILLGEGPERSALRSLGDSLGLGKRLLMPGFVRNPHAIVARSALLVHTSNHEGFCNALTEAMALEVPVIATDCLYGNAEILDVDEHPADGEVVRGKGGLLIRTNDEQALVRAMALMSDGSFRARTGSEGRERMGAFSSSAAYSRYWSVFEQALRPSSAKADGAESAMQLM
jgi:N-acetylgalactosamine-N,N'-diacetylbacillosaminyl-diphospho-undecaprenol 4-alpha-N-acetylgalactosaminyltransferase